MTKACWVLLILVMLAVLPVFGTVASADETADQPVLMDKQNVTSYKINDMGFGLSPFRMEGDSRCGYGVTDEPFICMDSTKYGQTEWSAVNLVWMTGDNEQTYCCEQAASTGGALEYGGVLSY